MSAKLGSFSIVCIQLGPRKLSIIQSSRVSAIQRLLKYEVNGRTVETFRIVISLSAVEGCLLSRVPLYVASYVGCHGRYPVLSLTAKP